MKITTGNYIKGHLTIEFEDDFERVQELMGKIKTVDGVLESTISEYDGCSVEFKTRTDSLVEDTNRIKECILGLYKIESKLDINIKEKSQVYESLHKTITEMTQEMKSEKSELLSSIVDLDNQIYDMSFEATYSKEDLDELNSLIYRLNVNFETIETNELKIYKDEVLPQLNEFVRLVYSV